MKRQTLEKLRRLLDGLVERELESSETGESSLRIVLRRDAGVDLGDVPGLQLELDAELRDHAATSGILQEHGYGTVGKPADDTPGDLEAAFLLAVQGLLLGKEETDDARHYFRAGWDAQRRSFAVGTAELWETARVGYGSRLYTVSECADPPPEVYADHPHPWRAIPKRIVDTGQEGAWIVEDAKGEPLAVASRDVCEWIAALPELLQELATLAGRDDE